MLQTPKEWDKRASNEANERRKIKRVFPATEKQISSEFLY